jgi:hypothetical protein
MGAVNSSVTVRFPSLALARPKPVYGSFSQTIEANDSGPIGFSNVVTISVGDVAISAPSAGVDGRADQHERAARAEQRDREQATRNTGSERHSAQT